MSARAVDVAILILLVLELASGPGFPGRRAGQPVALLAAPCGGCLARAVLLVWKCGMAQRSHHRRSLRAGTGLSAVFGVLFLGSLATGVLWAVGGCRACQC